MPKKKWWASKAVWAGVIAVLVTAYNTASGQFLNAEGASILPAIPEFVFGILAAMGIYGRVSAKTEIK